MTGPGAWLYNRGDISILWRQSIRWSVSGGMGMSEKTCCSFCEQLPTVVRPSRGSPSKCPLCRHELWTSPDGTTHRLMEGPPPRTMPRFMLAGLGVGLLGIAVAGIGLTRLRQEQSPASAPIAAESPPVSIASAPAAVKRIESPPVQVKGAIPDGAARVKPLPEEKPVAKSAVKYEVLIAECPPRPEASRRRFRPPGTGFLSTLCPSQTSLSCATFPKSISTPITPKGPSKISWQLPGRSPN